MEEFRFRGYTVEEAMDGLFAHDQGSDSGIRDEDLKDNVQKYLKDLPSKDYDTLMTRMVRIYSEPPYTWEDVKTFLDWVEYDLFD